ncbi:PepSY-associated TM helix domain-containing protein [Maribellus sp. YY47]|uniref:PepSY-associated TM helix domain-containing protein n=1 Tax=Maribellus sp. YY47 TaxID=2929486 RepID=UPI002000D1BC|nr:PepSY-associated TM helix domain-containing protein [Maribellus sp. YY47]MCK3684100.1 PepSY domain-containing protein [Maribellus sp. YY47]
MKRTRIIKTFKKLHRWPAVVIAFISVLFATSGIIMNHRGVFSGVDVSRSLLPENYTYSNWNQSAVRGSLEIDSATVLIYGNIGVWKSDPAFSAFEDFNNGFPKGIDNRKIYSLIAFKQNLYAGTHLGLYFRSSTNGNWEKITLPVKNDRITDVILKGDSLLVLTRDYLLSSTDGVRFQTVQLPAPVNYKRETGLFDTFWQLHSGELFGLTGKLIVDLLGIITIVLSVTGLLHFFFPEIIRRRKKKARPTQKYVGIKKQNLHWHNVLGYIFALFLIINTFAGIHLRPPLLIAIASKQVGIIPGTHLDSPNPWMDKLRRVYWDETRDRYIFSTSDGFYFADETLQRPLQPAQNQPPVSVMGCNVLEKLNQHQLLVGSFSGMFIWNIETGRVSDFFSGAPYQAPSGMVRPIGANMAAGLVKSKNQAWWFDYNSGAISLSGKVFPDMPQQIRKASPMSLWNVSQEIHTGRIFESILGPFYILFVPLAGICLLIVLISGVIVWWMVYRKKRG